MLSGGDEDAEDVAEPQEVALEPAEPRTSQQVRQQWLHRAQAVNRASSGSGVELTLHGDNSAVVLAPVCHTDIVPSLILCFLSEGVSAQKPGILQPDCLMAASISFPSLSRTAVAPWEWTGIQGSEPCGAHSICTVSWSVWRTLLPLSAPTGVVCSEKSRNPYLLNTNKPHKSLEAGDVVEWWNSWLAYGKPRV